MYKLDNNVEWTEELKNAFKTGTTRAKIIYDGDKEINETNCLKQLELKDTQYVPGLGIIGQAVSKELSFSFVNKEGINLENQEVTLKIGAEYNGDVYYITYGNFIVYEAPKNDNTNEVTSVVANDYMKKFDILYEDSTTYPCTLRELTEDICQKVGVELGSESFTNEDFIIVDNQFEGKTAREVIQNVAKSAFSWARIGQDNKLYFDFEPSEEIEIVGSNFTITNANSMQQAEITELQGNTTQEGTPTPSSPVEVKTVSGDNNVVVSNKNLIANNIETQEINGLTITKGTDGSLLISGTSNATTRLNLMENFVIGTGSYVWSSNATGTVSNNCYLSLIKTGTTTELSGSAINLKSATIKTITISETTNTYVRFYVSSGITFTNFKIYPMLEKGNQATTYIAHQGNSYRVDLRW